MIARGNEKTGNIRHFICYCHESPFKGAEATMCESVTQYFLTSLPHPWHSAPRPSAASDMNQYLEKMEKVVGDYFNPHLVHSAEHFWKQNGG